MASRTPTAVARRGTARTRAGAGDRRDERAGRRDDDAEERDDVAARRDRAADIADRRSIELEGSDGALDGRTLSAQELRARGLEGRERAAGDRERAKSDRTLAKADRVESRVRGYLAALVDSSEDAIITKTLDGVIDSWNPGAQELFGYTAQEALGESIAMLFPLERRDELAQILRQINRGERVEPLETVRVAKDGRPIDVSLRISPVYNAEGELVGASSISRDITERKQIEIALFEAEQRFRAAFEHAPIGVCLLSVDPSNPRRLVQVNPALAEILGRSVEELTGRPLSSWTHPEDYAGIDTRLSELTEGPSGHVEFETRFMHRNGHPVWVLISAALLTVSDGEPTLAVTHVIDISDRKRSEDQLQHLADHDALTGLFNRRRFTEELGQALQQAKRFGDEGAVLFLDLDGFKFVNDTLGHAAGDELIACVAGLLRRAVRETDTLARMGGDEFAILLARCDETAAVLVAEKLLALLRRENLSGRKNRHAFVSGSLGIAVFGADAEVTADELVVEADIAMYDAKAAGKDCYAVYDRREGRRDFMSIRESWNERLRTAIDNDSFVLHAQPIKPICANGTPGFELLLRLPDDHGDLIPPGTFLYNAERFGLIQQIDRWVLERAVRRLHDSHLAGSDLVLSVNVSGTTMGDPELGADVAKLLFTYPIPPDRLIIEITETAAIKNIESARSLAQQLRALGCKLALDDFGAGFASFYYLKHLDFDYLKIDGEFIRKLASTPTDQLVVQAIVTIAHGLGTKTIAEFVGDDATMNLLEGLGVDYGQGYHLGRPRPLEQSLPYLIASASAGNP
jgi:diguanylate cyclase (GGDEF)-like protein/PAS domain S-box-containing protein